MSHERQSRRQHVLRRSAERTELLLGSEERAMIAAAIAGKRDEPRVWELWRKGRATYWGVRWGRGKRRKYLVVVARSGCGVVTVLPPEVLGEHPERVPEELRADVDLYLVQLAVRERRGEVRRLGETPAPPDPGSAH